MNIKSKIFYNHIVLEFLLLILDLQTDECLSDSNEIVRGNVKPKSFASDPIGYQNYLNIINKIQNEKNKIMDHNNSSNHHVNKTRKSLTSSLIRNNKMNGLIREKCTKSEKELDLCSAQLLAFGLSEAAFPNNIEQFDSEYCPNVRKLVSCIRNNTDCYQPFEKQVIR